MKQLFDFIKFFFLCFQPLVEELHKKSYRRKLFNDNSQKLIRQDRSIEPDINFRTKQLNTKWDTIHATVTPQRKTHTTINSVAGMIIIILQIITSVRDWEILPV